MKVTYVMPNISKIAIKITKYEPFFIRHDYSMISHYIS